MRELIENAGIFAWPLGLCSVLATVIIIERLFALRRNRIIPHHYEESFTKGSIPEEGDSGSVAGRIVSYYRHRKLDSEQLKAYTRLQVTHMERGLFILEIVVSAAPLLGLLGTVTGLVTVFGQISPETGLPDPAAFVEGVSLALTTTILGLSIAIPSLAFNSYLSRRVDTYEAQLEVGVERLIAAMKEAARRP
ncbi:MAG TPA: MotA/TolQ/ExbB proton channel family protein [Oceanipulchritudo sp.]|nr:MotA/TolQ/ExbB proton channel family protein [Oceanipulchritudo sp.]